MTTWDADGGPLEDPSGLPPGAVLYASTFMPESYLGSGKRWRNVIAPAGGINTDEKDMQFCVEPAFSRLDGISMNANSITGPLSHRMDITGDLAFTFVVLCQFTGVTSGRSDVILLRLYANTPNNNGYCIYMNNFTTMPGNMISMDMYVSFGSLSPMRCSQASMAPTSIMLDTTKKYMIVASKGAGRLRVTLVDVGVRTSYDSQVLLDSGSMAMRESVVFSNREMMINNNENFNANIMAFGVFNRVLGDTAIHALYLYYNGVFRKMDPEYAAVARSLRALEAAKLCPYDEATCTACTSVADFTDDRNIMASSTQCLSAIDSFCTMNPGHPRCWCWDIRNPYYGTCCKVYRNMFTDQHNASALTAAAGADVDPSAQPDASGGAAQGLMQYIASDPSVDSTSSPLPGVVNTLLSALQKPGVGDALTTMVSRAIAPTSPTGTAAPVTAAPTTTAAGSGAQSVQVVTPRAAAC
ncbi:hypothetical protein HYH03_003876 [Edaphochlamys debaryana]|uniref:Uncharacterized protein n=1 Tax=Edaphochlamys debaryana TaxID=47281 RepID=A0A836C3S3_9CHLO|nr:hypothetical protein HYH03_003876 [Edaphochlamys debaryana]|eukprot:KAG2498118.1 hypothetical protein HYH03_003876 [Edaphochlamys debaryana]